MMFAEFVLAIAVMAVGVSLGWHGTTLTLGLVAITALFSGVLFEIIKNLSDGGDVIVLGPLADALSFVSLVCALIAMAAWLTAALRFLFVTAHPLTWGMFFR